MYKLGANHDEKVSILHLRWQAREEVEKGSWCITPQYVCLLCVCVYALLNLKKRFLNDTHAKNRNTNKKPKYTQHIKALRHPELKDSKSDEEKGYRTLIQQHIPNAVQDPRVHHSCIQGQEPVQCNY